MVEDYRESALAARDELALLQKILRTTVSRFRSDISIIVSCVGASAAMISAREQPQCSTLLIGVPIALIAIYASGIKKTKRKIDVLLGDIAAVLDEQETRHFTDSDDEGTMTWLPEEQPSPRLEQEDDVFMPQPCWDAATFSQTLEQLAEAEQGAVTKHYCA